MAGPNGVTPEGIVLEHLRQWGEDLVDLTRRNRLLYFRHLTSGSFEFTQPAPAIIEGLGRPGWGFHLPPVESEDVVDLGDFGETPVPAPDELVVAPSLGRTAAQIERGLKNLAGKAQAELLDAGIWVLYLGLGFLRWNDGQDDISSPLYLLPVQLTQRPGDKTWRLTASDDGEAALNPSLAVKLESDFGISLPSLDELEENDYASAIAAVRAAVTNPQWTIDETAVLANFTFQKDVVYRDLRSNTEIIAQHPIVRLLAEGPTGQMAEELGFTPEADEDLDDRHPPEDMACILDLDATQRRCLIAARQGESFVMDGPPGTGKSQTIANVIAQLLNDGKTVLFVSEKAAALDVVQNRLSDVGLGPFVFGLHSHKATRKAVAQELGAALNEAPQAKVTFTEAARARLRRNRQQLTSYAIAMNEVRRPLDLCLHDVIGRIAQLDDLPQTVTPSIDTSAITATELVDIIETARQLGNAWGPVSRGDRFTWRDLATGTPQRLTTASARDAVDRLRRSTGDLADALDVVADDLQLEGKPNPSDADGLIALLALVERRAPVGAAWLTTPDLDAMTAVVDELCAAIDRAHTLEQSLLPWTESWRDLDPAGVERLDDIAESLGQLDPTPASLAELTAADLEALASRLTTTADQLHALAQHAEPLRVGFDVTEPLSMRAADSLSTLASMAGVQPAPETAWFDPIGLQRAREARAAIGPLLEASRAHAQALGQVFKPGVLDLDLAGLHIRFTEINTGFKKLGRSYKDDKATLAAATVAGVTTKEHIEQLPAAIEWQQCVRELERAESTHAAALGRYYPDRTDADLGRINAALGHAEQAVACASGLVAPASTARVLGFDAVTDASIGAAAGAVRASVDYLRSLATDAWMAQVWPSLEDAPLAASAQWCASAAALIHHAAAETQAVQALTTHRVTAKDANALLVAREHHAHDMATIGGLTNAHAAALGALAVRPDTTALRTADAWVREVRLLRNDAPTEATAAAMLSTALRVEHLSSPLEAWRSAVDALLVSFAPERASILRADLEHSFAVADDLIDELGSSIGDIDEWHQYSTARARLIERGLGPLIVSCEAQRVDGSDLGGLAERAVLRQWADHVVAADDRLQPGRAIDRDQIRSEFRALDEALIAGAAAEIINRCSDRRPKSAAGGAGVIRQQAELKRKHKPVRVLLEQASEAAQRLKPCFMMSPLSVSQFLPPTMRFDVVIFDEASQVREADAICSIYRGRQLIVAGDQRQLPPTSFFDRMGDGDDTYDDSDETPEVHDFESVLDRCKAQGFQPLPLNWHYRSRHESLIAYSNYSFYEGRLNTFPGAVFEAPDLGVELFHANGTYRRGSTRDNPIEAATVVDRVLFHRRNHPGATIGVVALSTAQQSAVEAEIERRSDTDPELAELVTDDRLDGFFVKNLESVQGDERDIIIFTIGYGPDEAGKLTMNFGPMNSVGGERRLNVAVTRARRRVEVVSSIRAGNIQSDNPSLRHLARYLDYAERGMPALSLDIEGSSGDTESPFEEEVLRSIRTLGFDPVPQVGVAGYRIDLGVRHPSEPGSYVLGVECDGAAYHSSKVARDRDRLRQQVLEGLGWQIHRIWSTAWFSDRGAEVERLRRAIVDAIEADARPRPAEPTAVRPPAPEVTFVEVDFDKPPEWAIPFVEPQPGPLRVTQREFHDPAEQRPIRDRILAITQEHGPVHADVVLSLLRQEWGLGRSGSRVQGAFQTALDWLGGAKQIEVADSIIRLPGQTAQVRIPFEADGPRRKKVGEVPADEQQLAILNLLGDAGETNTADLCLAWARLFGWARIGTDINSAFERAIDELARQGKITAEDPIRLASDS
ncbi:MAG: DUF3320 domain-containing protein [Acidimicrobiales bacterium]